MAIWHNLCTIYNRMYLRTFIMDEKKILIVDDDPVILSLVEEILSKKHYTILKTDDGISVLPKVHSEHPDLIILDIMLPNISGFEICEKLKKDNATKNIPILIISGHISRQLILNLHALGIHNCLSKPFDTDDLINQLDIIDKTKY